MDRDVRPYRSVLYIPASNRRALDKAQQLAADAIIFDLEDAVSPAAKAEARHELVAALRENDYGNRPRIVRINGFDSDWAEDDLKALAKCAADAVLLPKVAGAADLDRLCGVMTGALADVPVWAMMETPDAVLNAGEIAAAPRLAGMVMGTNDLAKELGCRFRADRMPMLMALQTCLMAARARALVCVDGVYNAFKDDDGLRQECLQGRDMGFDGKSLIHPSQLIVANEVFAPSPEEVDLSRRQIEAFEAARAQGKGIAVLDGKIIENLHVASARQVLERYQVIASEGANA